MKILNILVQAEVEKKANLLSDGEVDFIEKGSAWKGNK